MPVTTLFVEGDLDAQLLAPFLAGAPTVEKGGSKNALAQIIRQERARRVQGAKPDPRYLRDRDFDFLPAPDSTGPVADRVEAGSILGWRWARHEIENYMLEPHFVALCLGVDQGSYESALTDAARVIKYYQSARWTIGQARTQLPPAYKFGTSPDVGSAEFYLPDELASEGQREWARIHTKGFLERVSPVLDERKIVQVYDEFAGRFADDFLQDPANILVWFSGKDLMKALEPWLRESGISSAGMCRARLRDWMAGQIEEVADYLSEWRSLRELLRR